MKANRLVINNVVSEWRAGFSESRSTTSSPIVRQHATDPEEEEKGKLFIFSFDFDIKCENEKYKLIHKTASKMK